MMKSMMHTTSLTSKGQVTIPKDIREKLGLKPGDRVIFDQAKDGTVQVRRAQHAEEIAGMLKQYARGQAPAKQEIKEISAQAAVERYERSRT